MSACVWPGCDEPATKRQRCARHYDVLYQCGRFRARLVDPGPARARIAELAQRGLTQQRTAELAGLTRSTIERITAGRLARIRLSTADKILGMPLPPDDEGVRLP